MGIRTPDLLNAIEALYQLSYDPQASRYAVLLKRDPRKSDADYGDPRGWAI